MNTALMSLAAIVEACLRNCHGPRVTGPCVRRKSLAIVAAHSGRSCGYKFTRFSRSALVTTDTELNAIAAPAKTGDNKMPNVG